MTQAVYSPGGFFTAVASLTRPANTTAYAAHDAVLAATSGADALEIRSVSRFPLEAMRIERLRLRKSSATLTGAQFRVHVFRIKPALSANDNDAFDNGAGVLALADITGHIGTFDITMTYAGAAGAHGEGVPAKGAAITCESAGAAGSENSVWAVIETLAAYTPASAETFVVTLEGARS